MLVPTPFARALGLPKLGATAKAKTKDVNCQNLNIDDTFVAKGQRDEEWVSVYELAEACMKRGTKEFMEATAPVAK